jgi:hypothetical protein
MGIFHIRMLRSPYQENDVNITASSSAYVLAVAAVHDIRSKFLRANSRIVRACLLLLDPCLLYIRTLHSCIRFFYLEVDWLPLLVNRNGRTDRVASWYYPCPVCGILCRCEKIPARVRHGPRFSEPTAENSGNTFPIKPPSYVLSSYKYKCKASYITYIRS